jgi:hypothetical protein
MSAKAKTTEELTPEEMELNKKRFLFANQMITEDPDAPAEIVKEPDPEPPKEPVVEAPKVEEPKVEPVVEPVKEPEPPKEEKKPSAAATAVLDEERIERMVAVEADQAVRRAEEARKPAPVVPAAPAPDTFEANLPAVYKRDLNVLRRLEQGDPSYKGIAGQMLDFYRREGDYIAKWERDNPTQEFNPEAEEHAGLYAQQPKVDDDVVEATRENMLLERAKAEAKAEALKEAAVLKEEVEGHRFEQAMKESAPAIQAVADGAVVALITMADPELAKAIPADKRLNEGVVAKMEEADPVAFEIVNEEAEHLRVLTTELERLTRFAGKYEERPGGYVKLASNGQMIYPHQELQEFAVNLETELSKMPKDETVKDGKRFMTQATLYDRLSKIRGSNLPDNQKAAAERDLIEGVWTVGTREILSGITAARAEKAKARIEKINTLADKRAKKNGVVAGKPTPETPKEQEQEQEQEQVKTPAAPSSNGAPVTVSSSDRTKTAPSTPNAGNLSSEQVQRSMWQ